MFRGWFVTLQVFVLVYCVDDNAMLTSRSTKCIINEEFVYPNASCYAKSYSRNVSTLNYYLAFKKPMQPFFVSIYLQFKYGMIYREVLSVPRTDLCEQVLNEAKAHPVIRQFMELIKDGKKNKLQLCPYKGVTFRNETFKAKRMMGIFPTGDYKVLAFFTDAENVSIFNITTVTAMKSSNRDTFG